MTKELQCAKDIAKWLAENDLQLDVSIYVDGKRYKVSESGKLVFDIEADPRAYFRFNGDFLSMSFEGSFYRLLNWQTDDTVNKLINQFESILAKYNKYYELGNAWNLSLYDL